MIFTSELVSGSMLNLQGWKTLTVWAHLRLKLSMSRLMMLWKWKMVGKFWFSTTGITTPIINEKPVKSLGMVFNSTLRDATSINSIYNEETRLLQTLKHGCASMLYFPVYYCYFCYWKLYSEQFRPWRRRFATTLDDGRYCQGTLAASQCAGTTIGCNIYSNTCERSLSWWKMKKCNSTSKRVICKMELRWREKVDCKRSCLTWRNKATSQ